MSKIRDLIPKDVLDRWNGENYYISNLDSLDNEPTLWINLINKNGPVISIAFDLHQGVEVNKKSKHDKALELLKRWDSVKIPSTVWTTPAENFTLPEDTQVFLNGIENNREVK